ncbi:MAG: hypothetical protein DYG91_06945 [Chloroflexi bacterium CFX7]|nr:hypothetical protein [Chloroflexi bacterium CFX7]RIL04198.1 MAG: hypothetical protein DCC78_01050 [bacterium]
MLTRKALDLSIEVFVGGPELAERLLFGELFEGAGRQAYGVTLLGGLFWFLRRGRLWLAGLALQGPG